MKKAQPFRVFRYPWHFLLGMGLLFSMALDLSSRSSVEIDRITESDLRLVNLETAMVVRSLNHLSWEPDLLPSTNESLILLVVGQDRCSFSERLSYLIKEGGVEVGGRPLRVEAMKSLIRAKDYIARNQRVMVVVLLNSSSDVWDHIKIPDRPGLLIYGQGSQFLRRGLGFVSRVENNRVKISVNLKKLEKVNLQVDQQILSFNRSLFETN